MSEACENCRYALDTKSRTVGSVGWVCRRFPPINVHAVNAYELDEASLAPKIIANGCPVPVNHDWWCGEWKPRMTN